MTENRRADPPLADLVTPIRTTPPGKFVEETTRVRETRDAAPDPVFVFSRGVATLVVTLMAGAGAAAAVLVFHERLARILLRIQ